MISSHFNDKSKNTFQNRKLSSSIAIQYDQQDVINDNISQAVQCEQQDYFSCGTQCEITKNKRNSTTETKGVQCSLENISVLFGSRSSQSNSLQYVSKSTQWSSEDVSISNSSSQLDDIHVEASDSADISEYIACDYPQTLFSRENAASTSHKHSSNLEETEMARKYTNVKHSQRLKLRKKNMSASTLFGPILRQRKNTYTSSTTSGVTEMFSSRSGLESLEESAVSVEEPVQIIKQKKKHLWTSRDSVASFSGSEGSLNFSSLYPKMEDTFPKCKQRTSRTFPVQSRCKYTYDEDLAVIKYISEKNLYKQVGGVAIWQRMESEIEVDRTWQSLKEHFRKKILPNIDEFDLPKKVEKSFRRIIMR